MMEQPPQFRCCGALFDSRYCTDSPPTSQCSHTPKALTEADETGDTIRHFLANTFDFHQLLFVLDRTV